METYKDRLMKEYADLCEKRERLAEFASGEIFGHLDSLEQTRLVIQAFIMSQYKDILQERIEADNLEVRK